MFESSEIPTQEHTETLGVEKHNSLESYGRLIEQNMSLLREAVKSNDQEAIDLLGSSIEKYTTQENEIIESISSIDGFMCDINLSNVARALLENDKIELEKVLGDIRAYTGEYRNILLNQLETESEN